MTHAERMAKLIPTNWLDPLLTGPKAVIGEPPYSCPDIERLLDAVKKRLREAAHAPKTRRKTP